MFACNDNLNNLGVGINWSGDLDLPKFSSGKDFECAYLDMSGYGIHVSKDCFPSRTNLGAITG